mmetsp:Transcript_44392/g.117330  ORF Transcript_44392/g.117330 Transcript_44392/m.117330 type:complete len:265 (-) Transcript_44392:297-1091(-)
MSLSSQASRENSALRSWSFASCHCSSAISSSASTRSWLRRRCSASSCSSRRRTRTLHSEEQGRCRSIDDISERSLAHVACALWASATRRALAALRAATSPSVSIDRSASCSSCLTCRALSCNCLFSASFSAALARRLPFVSCKRIWRSAASASVSCKRCRMPASGTRGQRCVGAGDTSFSWRMTSCSWWISSSFAMTTRAFDSHRLFQSATSAARWARTDSTCLMSSSSCISVASRTVAQVAVAFCSRRVASSTACLQCFTSAS